MSRFTKPRTVVARTLALVTVLAITAAWALPQHPTSAGNAMVDSAAAAPRVAAAISVPGGARDQAFDGWAAARSERTSTTLQGADGHAKAAASVATKAERSARAAAAATTSNASKKGDATSAKPAASTAKSPTYRGTNRFWIPSLGMSYGVHWYGCSASYYPKNVIYRWGCAGRNNVYLFGHAYGVMKPLHDLYVRGGLRKGMVAVFADANGRVTKYRVTEWRVVRPTEIAWQIASQPRPSMTLQTCVGKDSQYRLNVRLVAFD
jgi:hypothetical protein